MNEKDIQSAPPRSGRRIASMLFFGANAQILAILFVIALGRLLLYDRTRVFVWINMYTVYIYLPAYLILLVGLLARRKYLAMAAGGIIVFHLFLILPNMTRAIHFNEETTVGESIRLFSANLTKNNEHSAEMLAEIEQADPDVLLFQEYTPLWDSAFSQSQLVETYPYRLLNVEEGPSGSSIWSKRPLHDTDIWFAERVYITSATIEISDQPVRLHNIHPLPPLMHFRRWDPMMDKIRQGIMTGTIPVIAIGDYNAGPYNRQYQALLDEGLHNLHDELGRSLATTWPNGLQPAPPVRLDHAFVSSEIVGLSIREGVGLGSDHKPVIVDVALVSSP
ncbi:MAG: endonuclease/exonuclease/phosphatase family protein [Ardenticatenaceae bacterium]|nr:endonuclease/exonuclease/phosphatase family protein [Ardenticatenaceae bacterium]